MPRIDDVELTIIPDRPQNRARVAVSCNVEFTEFEVNTMNMLGLRYTLDCRILEDDIFMLPEPDPVVTFHALDYPRLPGGVERHERATFETLVPMSDLHEHDFGTDKLVAELKLQNEETGEWVVGRSQVVAIDLAA
jgi:hypothetical protein